MFKLIFFLLFSQCLGNTDEKNLLDKVLQNHNNQIRPIINYSEALEVQLGLGVQTIEAFNQVEETLTLNIWQRMDWKDQTINWNSSTSKLNLISLSPDDIWTPDLELLNAANLPEIYTLKGGLYLHYDGNITYSKPTILKFSCPLELSKFPFDSQNCVMNISSWIYTNNLLKLIPNEDVKNQIDVLDSFRHSEWEVIDYGVKKLKQKRSCCKKNYFDVLSYNFKLKRYTHYYKINMGMTITLVIVSFILMFMPADNVSRTGTLVFIPLTILALQLTLSGKIPVVGYYTIMDYFFLLCFITSMLCSIESGLVYCLVTTKTPQFYACMNRKFKYFDSSTGKEDDNTNNEDTNRQFSDIIDNLNNQNNKIKRTIIYTEGVSSLTNRHNSGLKEVNENNSLVNQSERDLILKQNNIQKIINYDDKTLNLTDEELEIDKKINLLVVKIDSIYRLVLPTIFFILIIVIFSYEE